VQVHPDDEAAKRLEGENCRGKTECWYVLNADEGASLVYGLKGNPSKEEIRSAIKENTLEKLLDRVQVKKGDFIFIPSGTVHAIGGGLRLLEVQQSCNITYRLYDWGRGRECQVEKGLSCIKNLDAQKLVKFPGTFRCPYFTLEEIFVNGKWSEIPSPATESEKPSDRVLYFVIEGEGTVNLKKASPEDMFAFAPDERIEVEGNLRLMKIRAM
jgi:mannose-6-phosphate isomerase